MISLAARPHIDLFVSAENTRLPVFCTRFLNPQAWATDALLKKLECTVNKMGRHVHLRLPPNIATPKGDSQDREGTMPCSFHHSILAMTVIVPQANQAPGAAATDPAL